MEMKVLKNAGTIYGDKFAELVKEYITDPVYFEVGAFNGRDVEQFLQGLPEAKAYAFEANPATYHFYLEKPKNYKAFCVALSDVNGESSFYVSRDTPTSSLLYRDLLFKERISVDRARMDTFLYDHDLPQPDVVKIDCEGTTYEVLKGMGNLLPQTKILYLETEKTPCWTGQHLHKDVEKLLEPNFECILLHDNGEQMDSVWIRK